MKNNTNKQTYKKIINYHCYHEIQRETITAKYTVFLMYLRLCEMRNKSLIEAKILKKALPILQPQYIHLPLKASATTQNGFFS